MNLFRISCCYVPLIAVALAFGSILLTHVATPGAGRQFQGMVDLCYQEGVACPELLFKFNAFQQIYVVPTKVASKFVPPEVKLWDFFGFTVGALFVVEYEYVSYDETPVQKGREVDILQLTATGPDGFSGAWASHVLLNNAALRRMGRMEMGVPAQIADIQVERNCAASAQGIDFFLKGNSIERVVACLPEGAFEGRTMVTLTNHTLPNLTGRIPKDLNLELDALPHQELGVENLTALMMYLLTFHSAEVKISSSVPQRVHSDDATPAAADLLSALIGDGIVLPFSTVLANVSATTWDTAQLTPDGWRIDAHHHLADGSRVSVPWRKGFERDAGAFPSSFFG